MHKSESISQARFVLTDPRYSSRDRLEYLGFLSFVLVSGAVLAYTVGYILWVGDIPEAAECLGIIAIVLLAWLPKVTQVYRLPYVRATRGKQQADQEISDTEHLMRMPYGSAKPGIGFTLGVLVLLVLASLAPVLVRNLPLAIALLLSAPEAARLGRSIVGLLIGAALLLGSYGLILELRTSTQAEQPGTTEGRWAGLSLRQLAFLAKLLFLLFFFLLIARLSPL